MICEISRNHLKALREDGRLTGKQLAKKSNVALRTILNIEANLKCRQDTKRKLLRALGIPWENRHAVWPHMVWL